MTHSLVVHFGGEKTVNNVVNVIIRNDISTDASYMNSSPILSQHKEPAQMRALYFYYSLIYRSNTLQFTANLFGTDSSINSQASSSDG